MTRRGLRSALLSGHVRRRSWRQSSSPRPGVAPPPSSRLATRLRRFGLRRPGPRRCASAVLRLHADRSRGGEPSHSSAAAACDAASGVACSDRRRPARPLGSRAGHDHAARRVACPPRVPERGVMMLVAGGPGQGSATVFNISDKDSAELYHALFPGYRIVAFDNRGTGKSGLLVCSALQQAIDIRRPGRARRRLRRLDRPDARLLQHPRSRRRHGGRASGARSGQDRDLGHVVRHEAGLAYALAYPTHVERLLLDSVLPTEYPEPFEANVLHDMPLALSSYCGGGACRAATPNFAADVAAVANALARTPARGVVRLANGIVAERAHGRARHARARRRLGSEPGPRCAAAGGDHAARAGRHGRAAAAALPRHRQRVVLGRAAERRGSTQPRRVRDGHFPWDAAAPIADRPARLTAAVSLAAGGRARPVRPLGDRARHGERSASSGRAPRRRLRRSAPGPLPDVPVLALSGGYDMRTPTSSAAAVVRSFPHGQLLVVPAVGHSVVGADISLCAIRAVRSWVTDGNVPPTCQRPSFIVAAGRRVSARRPVRLGPRRRRATFALAGRTIKEAEAMWLTTRVRLRRSGRRA